MYRTKAWLPYLLVTVCIGAVALISYYASVYTGYRSIAFFLLFAVAVLATLLDTLPVIYAACLSAVVWNFFFIPPVYTFSITETEDIYLVSMYFIIALIHTFFVTKLKQSEKKLQQQKDEQKTLELYNTIFNSLSHELRTPLAAILSATEMLHNEREIQHSKWSATLIDQIAKAADRLNSQIQNLLNMSRIESGTLKTQMEWCDISELIHRVLSRIDCNHRNITIQNDMEGYLVKADEGLLETAIQNIIQNALNHNSEDVRIKVHYYTEHDVVHLAISDSGKGVPQDQLICLFDKFYKLPGTHTGSIGLGLAIVKGCVRAHNGQVYAISENQKGLSIHMELPLPIIHTSHVTEDSIGN